MMNFANYKKSNVSFERIIKCLHLDTLNEVTAEVEP